jgi:hypothetical protein
MDSRPKAGKSEPTLEPISSPGKSACPRTLSPGAPFLFPRALGDSDKGVSEGIAHKRTLGGGPRYGGNRRGSRERWAIPKRLKPAYGGHVPLFDFDEEGAVVHGLADADMDGSDNTRLAALDLVLHLHRFHD